jgi:predicted ATPase
VIHALRLWNFKCFEDQLFRFSGINLLTGLNGMGKSSVLQALLLLRQSFQQGLIESTGIALNGDLTRIGTAADALYEGAKSEEIAFAIEFGNDAVADWRFSYNREADVLALASGLADSTVYISELFGDQFQYLQAERLGPRTSFEMSDYRVRQHRQLGPRGEFTAHFLAVFGNDEVTNTSVHHPRASSASLRDQVEAWIGEISPGTRLHLTTNVGADLVNLQYSFVRGDQVSNAYRATNVGFGLTYVLPIIVAVLSAKPGALLLIENPEAHLHPAGQARMGELLARAAKGSVQAILETHSDHVLNGVRAAVRHGLVTPENVRIHFFQRGTDAGRAPVRVLSPQIDKDGRIDDWPENFFDQWDKSLEELLGPSGSSLEGAPDGT